MLRIGLKTLWAHKRRLIGTSLAVVLGIAFLTGTLVLGSTLRATFDELFTSVNKGTDAVVRSSTKFESDRGGTQRPPIDASLLGKVRSVPGVAEAQPEVDGYGVLLGKDGKQVTSNGPPMTAGNWIGTSPLNPFQLAQGRAPSGPHEAIIDRGLAKRAHVGVGDTTTVQLPQPYRVTIVGIATFGGEDSAAGQTFTGLTTAVAQQEILHSTAKVGAIRVRAAPGVSQEQVAASVQKVLPAGTQAITGSALTAEQKKQIGAGFLDFLTTFLLIFAIIALVVAVFSIYNTFSIIMAQRTRESALLRALGASRRQVLRSVLVETLCVGLFGAVVGLVAGLGVALGLNGLFQALGADLPTHALVVTPGTIVAAIVVGVVVTVAAGLVPALRSSRVAPMAALRDVEVDESSSSVGRLISGAVIAAVGLVVIVLGTTGGQATTTGIGGGLLLVGVVVLGPVVARPAASIIGLPAARTRGMSGVLARENAMRNPKRTASTAAALLVGVAVVTLFTVIGASLVASVNQSVDRSFAGDLVLTSGGFGGGGGRGFSPQLATQLNQVPQVEDAAGVSVGAVKVNTFDATVIAADPARLAAVIKLEVTAGRVQGLATDQIAVSDSMARTSGLHVGSGVTLQLPDGSKQPVTIGAIYKSSDILQTDYILPQQLYAAHAPQVLDQQALIKLRPGVSLADGQRAVEKVAKAYPGVKVQNRSQFRDTIAQGVATFLALVYAMLLLAVIIALFGIANTLSLSVYERTREIGLIRAVGGLRSQIRSMVRWESVMISVFATVGGIGLGVFVGWALIHSGSSSGSGSPTVFDPGLPQLVVVLLVGAFVGLIASIRPARRAARLNVLRAIAT